MGRHIALLISACALFTFISFGQKPKTDLVEVTKTDFTQFPAYRSDKFTVFGIHLGMDKGSVEKILSKTGAIMYQVDRMHSTGDYRIYVYDKNEAGKKRNCILYLIWNKGSQKLNRITFFKDFFPYLVGDSKLLLGLMPFDPGSNIRKNYLGDPDDSKVTLDVPSIKLKHTSYFYYSKWLELTYQESEEERAGVFAFVTRE